MYTPIALSDLWLFFCIVFFCFSAGKMPIYALSFQIAVLFMFGNKIEQILRTNLYFLLAHSICKAHTHTVHTLARTSPPPPLHWKNRKNNKRNSRKNNELFSRKNTKILHFTFQYEIFIDFKDKLSNNMEMHLHNTGRRVRRGTGGRASCQYEGERRKRDWERGAGGEGGSEAGEWTQNPSRKM